MRTMIRCGLACALLAVGYVLGSIGAFSTALRAQETSADNVSEGARSKISAAYDALNEAMQVLEGERRYESVTHGVNAFSILVGGVNAREDLESGRGVDPETYVALYAGLANDEIAAELQKDDKGRLTYKNKVIRIYPISKLQRLYADRQRLTGEEATE